MSLLNAWVHPGEAIVAVDTQGVRGDGSTVSMSKLITLPHITSVLAFRGTAAFSAGVVHACLSRSIESFDELLAELPGIVLHVDQMMPPFMRMAVAGEIGEEMTAVGWSAARSRMAARILSKRGDMAEFHVRDTKGCIAPWDVETMADIPQTPGAVERLARAQVQYLRARCGLGGGTLIVCRVTRRGITLKHETQLTEEVPA